MIALPAALVTELKRRRADQENERQIAGNLRQKAGWVFTNRQGGAVHPRTDHKDRKALLKAAGMRDARRHDARHTAATMLLVLGVPGRAVMDVMVGRTSA